MKLINWFTGLFKKEEKAISIKVENLIAEFKIKCDVKPISEKEKQDITQAVQKLMLEFHNTRKGL